jgi:hypothetical protein
MGRVCAEQAIIATRSSAAGGRLGDQIVDVAESW